MSKQTTHSSLSSRLLSKVKSFFSIRESAVFAVLLLAYVIMWAISPPFRTLNNHITILKQMTVVAVLAFGLTVVYISGGFDLSQAGIATLVGMLSGWAVSIWHWPSWLAIVFGLLLGALCGMFNALLIMRLRIEPAVVTLASSSIFMGIMYFWTKGLTISNLPRAYNWLGAASFGPVPVAVVVMFVLAVVLQWMLSRTVFGRHIFLLGNSKEAARLAGVQVERTLFGIYTIGGFVSGLAGIILSGRISASVTNMAAGMLTPTVAAVIIGGTWLSGGVGSMAGTLMGSAIMAILRNAIVVLQVDIYLQEGVVGVVTVLAVLMDLFRRKRLTLQMFLPKKRQA